jgi:cytochrome c
MRHRVFVAVGAVPVCLLFLCGGPSQARDSSKGKEAYGLCGACHPTDSSNGAGPGLAGIVGRKAGSVAGFRYSRAMKSSGIIWDDKTLDAYIGEPQRVVPGNVMPFSGIADPGEREDLVEYLKTLK